MKKKWIIICVLIAAIAGFFGIFLEKGGHCRVVNVLSSPSIDLTLVQLSEIDRFNIKLKDLIGQSKVLLTACDGVPVMIYCNDSEELSKEEIKTVNEAYSLFILEQRESQMSGK